jgi:CspA family cold shock protein
MAESDALELQRRTQHLRVVAPEHTGEVRWFSAEKGYGFIAPDTGGEDVFVRHSSIHSDGFRSLDPGQRVAFRVSDDGRGPRAVEVRPA